MANYTVKIYYDQSQKPDPDHDQLSEMNGIWGKIVKVSLDGLAQYISNPNYPSAPSDRRFIRTEEIKKLCDFAGKGFIVGVRLTGAASCDRITQGCACKPHDILDKSLKTKSIAENWQNWLEIRQLLQPGDEAQPPKFTSLTYTPRARKGDQKLSVRLPFENREAVKELDLQAGKLPRENALVFDIDLWPQDYAFVWTELWRSLKQIRDAVDAQFRSVCTSESFSVDPHSSKNLVLKDEFNGLVAGWHAITLTIGNEVLRTKVPFCVLRVGPTQDGKAVKYGNEVPVDQITNHWPADSYTGDYDLHELFSVSGAGVSDLTGLIGPDRPTTADATMARRRRIKHDSDFQSVLFWLTKELERNRNVVESENWQSLQATSKFDRYAYLIQHGPQHLYARYVAAHPSIVGSIRRTAARLPDLSAKIRKKITDSQIAGLLAAPQLFDEFVASLTQPDKDGVVIFAPGKQVFVVFGQNSIAKAYHELRVGSELVHGDWIDWHAYPANMEMPAERNVVMQFLFRITGKKVKNPSVIITRTPPGASEPTESHTIDMAPRGDDLEGNAELPAAPGVLQPWVNVPNGARVTAQVSAGRGHRLMFEGEGISTSGTLQAMPFDMTVP